MYHFTRKLFLISGILFLVYAHAQRNATVTIHTDKIKNTVSPSLHGIFFEEISHGGDGGLYAELIQNRGFEATRVPPGTIIENGFIVPRRTLHYNMNGLATDWKMPWTKNEEHPAWRLEKAAGAVMRTTITTRNPLNKATPNALEVNIETPGTSGKNNLINEGYWGMGIKQQESYLLSFYAYAAPSYTGPLTVFLRAASGKILATHQFKTISSNGWTRYTCNLTANGTDDKAVFGFSFGSAGKLWLDFVSLFPKETFKNRPNGLRKDLAENLANLQPAFVRWPGGCFVEGINVESAPNWKTSIGPVEERPGTFSVWDYWSTDGFGYHEFLQFCEDIHASALYVFNAGVSCEFRSGTYVPDSLLQPVINDVLDAIEYAIGPVTSKWGRLRAANGHPRPFPLKYVEVGNEQHGPWYAQRYNRFHEAIQKKYPQIKIISSMGIGSVNRHTLDSIVSTHIVDEHAYKPAWWAFANYNHFDSYKRGSYNVYVGEYATNTGVGKGNILAALCDAAYIMGMENNGDLVTMSSYAPLFENVNSRHWPVNLINFNAGKNFARTSYYAIQMMNRHRADANLQLATTLSAPPGTALPFAGGIGLATWDTQTEYADIEVIENGHTVYKSNFLSQPGEWKTISGKWETTKNGGLAQLATGAQLLNLLTGKSFNTYTLKLKARKISGYNAFIIPFAVKDSNNHQRIHIGSYVNQNAVVEGVTNGIVFDLSTQKKLPEPIQPGIWYDIRIEVGRDTVLCYLNNQLIISFSEIKKFITLAGTENISGDMIIKVVNGYNETCSTTFRLNGGFTPAAKANVYTLWAANTEAENSFEKPFQYVTVASEKRNISGTFTYTFKPNSITVLRIKSGKRAISIAD